jgi:hypothetical protein
MIMNTIPGNPEGQPKTEAQERLEDKQYYVRENRPIVEYPTGTKAFSDIDEKEKKLQTFSEPKMGMENANTGLLFDGKKWISKEEFVSKYGEGIIFIITINKGRKELFPTELQEGDLLKKAEGDKILIKGKFKDLSELLNEHGLKKVKKEMWNGRKIYPAERKEEGNP